MLWFAEVARDGYVYQSTQQSSVAFLPAFPLAGRTIAALTGLSIELSLILVANFFLIATFAIFHAYLSTRVDTVSEGTDSNQRSSSYALACLGLLPATFFFRVGYSDGMFLLLTLAVFCGLQRGWPLVLIAAVIGAATATRVLGIALLVPFAMYVWDTGKIRSLWSLLYLLLISCWGVLAYMTFLWIEVGSPTAFITAQEHWRVLPPVHWTEKVKALLSFEPFWSVYSPSSPAFWRRWSPTQYPLFNLHFVNPIYFGTTALLLVTGAVKRWLSKYEIALAVPLLIIPYVTRSFEMGMAGHARYAAAIFPVYIVLAHLLVRIPIVIAICLLALSGVFLAVFSALFAAGYILI